MLYMIMGRKANGPAWRPLAWMPTSTVDGETFPGFLYEPDAQVRPISDDPFDLYDQETAMGYIAQDVLRLGMKYAQDGETTPNHYRIVPVYTGLEHLLQPGVMIFCQSPDNTIAPCREWPADAIDDEERTPLCQMFGFRNIDSEDHEYNIPIYPAGYAKALVEKQIMAECEKHQEGWRYFTVPVGSHM